MSTNYCDSKNYSLTEKHKVLTPATADSDFSPTSADKFQQSGVINQLATFWGNVRQYENRNKDFLEQDDHDEDVQDLKSGLLYEKEESVVEWDLKVHIFLSDSE